MVMVVEVVDDYGRRNTARVPRGAETRLLSASYLVLSLHTIPDDFSSSANISDSITLPDFSDWAVASKRVEAEIIWMYSTSHVALLLINVLAVI